MPDSGAARDRASEQLHRIRHQTRRRRHDRLASSGQETEPSTDSESPDRSDPPPWCPDGFSDEELRSILDDPGDEHFVVLAARLLEATDDLEETAEYLEPSLLRRHYHRIRTSMGGSLKQRERRRHWDARLLETSESDGSSDETDLDSSPSPDGEQPSSDGTSSDHSAKEVGRQIRELRKREGLTQQALGERLNVSRQAISKVELGEENVTIERLQRIMKALGYQVKLVLCAREEA